MEWRKWWLGLVLAVCIMFSGTTVIKAEVSSRTNESEWAEVPALGGDIVYEDGWTMYENEGIAVSYTKGAKASLTFYGTGIKWIGQKDINFGPAIVTLDGEKVGEIDTNGSAQWGVTHFERSDLSEGVHTISIEPKEEGVFDISGAIDVEKFMVLYNQQAEIPATSVKLTASGAEMYTGGTITLNSDVEPFNAKNKNVVYSSSDESVAEVNEQGEVTGKKAGTVTVTASVPGSEAADSVEITVKEFSVGERRMQIDSEHPLFLHHLYRQLFTGLPGPLSGGKDIRGFWDSLKNKDSNGKGISEDLLENQAIIIHASGEVKGDETTLAWYEEKFKETVEDQIPFFIMVSNSGTSTSNGGVYYPPAIEWVSEMYDQYPNMMGVIFSENHNATSTAERKARSDYMREQVILAAEKGGYVIYSDMNDNSDYVESVLNDQALFDTLKQFKDNFVLLAKTTSAWSNVGYNSHESVAQGAWLADIAGNWGSLVDSWMWFIEGFGPLYGDETFNVMGGVEECRGPVTFPELLFEMRMEQQARAGATVFTFEHPDYTTSVAKDNGKDNQFTPAFTESIVKAMEYMKEYDIPDKEEVLETTKVAFSAEKGSLNDLAATVNLLNPLYGDKNWNGYNNGTMMVYFTGRYGTVPSLPKLATEEDKAQFDYILTKDSVINELKNEHGIKEFFDSIYPQNYEGDGYAHFLNHTWLIYNTNWNIDSRVQEELFSEQSVKVELSNNNLSADITFNPYTLLLVDDQKDGELRFRFNNYLVDKNEIWEGYDVNSTPHWNSDADTQMYNYLMDDYIPDGETQDDIYRNAVIRLSGLTSEPKLIMGKELINNDGTKQSEPPKTTWNAKTGEYVIELKGNGWQEFRVELGNSAGTVDKTELRDLINKAQSYVDDGTVDSLIESVKKIYLETLEKAKEILADDTATYEEVMDIQTKLAVCITTVDMKAGDKEALGMLLESAAYFADEVLENYLEAGQAEFKAARDEAQAVYDNGDAFEADVKAAYDKLFETMTALRMKADKTALKELIDMANGLNSADYTEESFAVVKSALASAQAVYDNEQATEEEVRNAEEALQNAIDALVEAEDPGTGENPGDGEDQKPDGSDGTGGTSDTAGGADKADGTPKTGDTAPVGAGMAVIFIALAAVGAAVARRKKKAQ